MSKQDVSLPIVTLFPLAPLAAQIRQYDDVRFDFTCTSSSDLSRESMEHAYHVWKHSQHIVQLEEHKIESFASWKDLCEHCDVVPNIVKSAKRQLSPASHLALHSASHSSRHDRQLLHIPGRPRWSFMWSIAAQKLFEILTRTRMVPTIAEMVGSMYPSSSSTSSASSTPPPSPTIIRFKSVHLCESPGSFISALQVFLTSALSSMAPTTSKASAPQPPSSGSTTPSPSNCETLVCEQTGHWIQHEWYASSLRGTGAMSANPLFQEATESHWMYGPDGSGDILKPDVLDDMFRQCGGDHTVDFVTGDGGMDVDDKPHLKESICFPLVFAQYRWALQLLKRGGRLALKVFNMYQACSRQLLIDMSRHFAFYMYLKPRASKAANTEGYLVASGYTPCSKEHLEYLHGKVKLDAREMTLWASIALKTTTIRAAVHDMIVLQSLQELYKESSTRQAMRIREFLQHQQCCEDRPSKTTLSCKDTVRMVKQYWNELFFVKSLAFLCC